MASEGSRAHPQPHGNQSNAQDQSESQAQGDFLEQRTSVTKAAAAQYTVDARLFADFEQSGESCSTFDNLQSLKAPLHSVPDKQITAYLSKIQRGGFIQPFGCMIAVDVPTFKVIAYSQNAREMLGITSQAVPTVDRAEVLTIGVDVRTLFIPNSCSLLVKNFMAPDVSLSNPLWVYSQYSRIPFFAILHWIEVGIVIDLEHAKSPDPALSIDWAVQSQKQAMRTISHLQSLPRGDVNLLCDAVVEKVRALTGYDRVMVYKFHEDEYGEVVAESKRSDLDPYMGLRYPATDIPQAFRFMFMQNRVRMIVDCNATPVPIIQDEALKQPLCLVGSTLRAPHSCHSRYMANMGSIASLVLAVIIHGEGTKKAKSLTRLWGLVVCHHTSAQFSHFPLRHVCEFIVQAFGLQLNMELQLATQMAEKRLLRIQTLLCDILLRDSPIALVTRNPNIMDLVKCDGAAMFYQGRYYQLGVTPTEAQIKDIMEWLLARCEDFTGMSTDNLDEAGYPGASSLCDAVCGIAVAKITSNDFLFWFRSHSAKEIKWGGAKHRSEGKDNGHQMHPRSSFKAFLEVVKSSSLPWESAEMDAIQSLQLILRDSFKEAEAKNSKALLHAWVGEMDLQGIDELHSVTREIIRLIETATAPVFAIDIKGCINWWNAKNAELTGLSVKEAIGKSLVHDLVHKESEEIVEKLLYHPSTGEEEKNVEIKLRTFGLEEDKKAVFVMANACCSRDYENNITGVCFVGQDVTSQKVVMDKIINIQSDYKAIIHSPNPLIPPIFASDENTCCSEWNTAMVKLTGWNRQDIIGKMLVGEIFGSCCLLKRPDDITKFMIVLHNAIGGEDTNEFPFSFFDKSGKYVEALLTANKRVNADGNNIGAFCFLQLASPELQKTVHVPMQQENKCFTRMKELSYICHEIENPLSGMHFVHLLFGGTELTEYQRNVLGISVACQKQMSNIIKDVDLDIIDNGFLKLVKADFLLGSLVDAVISQTKLLLRERDLQLIQDIPEEIKTMAVYGDRERVQQVLADFLTNMVQYAPSPEGWVDIKFRPCLKQISGGGTAVHIDFRITCPGEGLPPELIQDMFHSSRWVSKEGLGLSMCRKILKLMNGDVQYITESDNCYFKITLELPMTQICPKDVG